MITLIITFLLGIAVGLLIANLAIPVSGAFRIDLSDPEKDRYELVLNEIDNLPSKRSIRLRIETNAQIAQKKQLP